MTNRELANLAIKLVGVYCLVEAVSQFVAIAALAFAPERPLALGLYVGAIAFYAALAVLLIWKSDRLVDLVAPKTETPGERAEPGRLQAVLFAVVGVVLAAEGTPNLVLAISWYLAEESTLPQWPQFVGNIAQLAIGAALFLGSNGLVRVWRGLQRPPPPSPEA